MTPFAGESDVSRRTTTDPGIHELPSAAQYTPPQSDFRRFAINSSEMDQSEDKLGSVNTVGSGSVTVEKLTIADLFNFGHSYWTSRLETSGLRGLDEELSIYDLLDLDAEGDYEIDDGASEVDPSTEDDGLVVAGMT